MLWRCGREGVSRTESEDIFKTTENSSGFGFLIHFISFISHSLRALRSPLARDRMRYIFVFPENEKSDLNAFKNSRDLMVHLCERSFFCDVKDIEKAFLNSFISRLSRSLASRVMFGCNEFKWNVASETVEPSLHTMPNSLSVKIFMGSFLI